LKYYRLAASLPPLPTVPEAPPLRLGEFVPLLRQELSPRHWALAEALLLRVDVGNLLALLGGQEELFDGRGLHSRDELTARGGGELPDFLADFVRRHEEGGALGPEQQDQLWAAYYGYLTEVADAGSSRFLREWLAWELPLLNALARWRAERLGRDPEAARVEEPAAPALHEELLARLGEEKDPQERERLVDAARLANIEALSGIDPFSIDAVLAFLVALMVLDRWDLPKAASAEQLLEEFE